MTSPTPNATVHAINVVIDARGPLHAQNPTIHFHTSVMAGLGLPDFVLAKVSGADRTTSAWVVGNTDDRWSGCPTPWHGTVRSSGSLWRALSDGTDARSGDPLEVVVPAARLPVKGARVEQLIADNEIGLHRDDAARLDVRDWAVVNYSGVPAACCVRLLDAPDDLGFVRVPFHGRLLLGIPEWDPELPPELLVSPYPADEHSRPLVISTSARRSTRVRAFCDRILAGVFGSPEAVLRTVEAPPGEDQATTVRLPMELFALLGTEPGRQVSIEWGPQGSVLATALAADDTPDGLPPTQIVGDRLSFPPDVPPSAEIRVGATTRAALGIPRLTVVTVRRRIPPLIAARLHQLILPATGLFLVVAAGVRLRLWVLAIAVLVIGILLLAPLRIHRPRPGRIR